MFKKWLLALCVGGLTLNACAGENQSAHQFGRLQGDVLGDEAAE